MDTTGSQLGTSEQLCMHQNLLLDSMLHVFGKSDNTCNDCMLLYAQHGMKMLFMILAGSANV